MGKQIAKSQGNHSRRAGQRNQGLPYGIRRSGALNHLDSADRILTSADTLFEMVRRRRILKRWKVKFGESKTTKFD